MLLFDLGGVLIDFEGVSALRALLPPGPTDAEIKARWLACPHSEAFGCGRLDTEAFVASFLADWDVPLAPDAFVAAYRSWARGWLPGAEALLRELHGRFTLAALSNCNPLHWERLTGELGVREAFDHAWSSHELGLRKPDPAIYQEALQRLGCPPGVVLFFDDAPGNVAAARGCGMQAEVVDGPSAARAELMARGLI